MDLSLADTYYLKALDSYPYNLESATENLNYALSYNSDHAQANCLMGRMYMEILKDYELAERYFELAIINDLQYVDTYKWFSLLMIWKSEYERAEKIINYGCKVKGMNQAVMIHRKALISEAKGEYIAAAKLIKYALRSSLSNENIASLNCELERVKKKVKSKKKQYKTAKKVLKVLLILFIGRWQ